MEKIPNQDSERYTFQNIAVDSFIRAIRSGGYRYRVPQNQQRRCYLLEGSTAVVVKDVEDAKVEYVEEVEYVEDRDKREKTGQSQQSEKRQSEKRRKQP